MHFIRFIILTLFTTFICLRADALSSFTQLDSGNLNDQSLGFTIKTDNKNILIHFAISVQSKTEALTSFLSAFLEVFDGTNKITSCPVEKTQEGKSVIYEFDISPKYLTQSKFTFGNMAEANGQPMPAGDFYWFYLADFAGQQNANNVSQGDVNVVCGRWQATNGETYEFESGGTFTHWLRVPPISRDAQADGADPSQSEKITNGRFSIEGSGLVFTQQNGTTSRNVFEIKQDEPPNDKGKFFESGYSLTLILSDGTKRRYDLMYW